MYYLTDFCLLCLNSKQLNSVLAQDCNGVEVQEQLKYCLPEITISKSGIPEFICSSCRTTVQSFCKFKKMCLENYNRLIQNTQILQGSSDQQGQKFTELQIQIKKIDFLQEREQQVDSELIVEEEIQGTLQSLEEHNLRTNVDDDDDVDIKEEFIADSEDNKFCPKQVKYTSSSDNEQESVSRSNCEEDNQPNVNDANFSADTDNVNAAEETFKRDGYKCQICNKIFAQENNLIYHLETHAGIRNFTCSFCDKKFIQKVHLTEHVKIHIGIREHICSVCDKKFLIKGNLTQHMKIHVGIRDNQCSVCDKNFVRKSDLTRHIKIHEGIRDHKCSVCGRKFVQKCHLTTHMKVHE